MQDITNNIKKVMMVFFILFLALIIYITYFEMYNADSIASRQDNKILWAKREKILRGSIYDRKNKLLAKSEMYGDGKQKREYLYGNLFANVIGYEDKKYGLTGLEYKYDRQLINYNDIDILNVFKSLKNKKKELKKGYDLITTLDYSLQKCAYDLLGNNKGAVVAMDPKTGEILAMVSKPSFDPNSLDVQWDSIINDKDTPLINRAVSGLYAPGSTFKTITAVSSLENINDILNMNFEDKGKIEFQNGESISNYNGEVLGNINFEQAYIHSSNVVFGTLGIKLANEKLKQTAEKFYFNKTIPCEGLQISKSIFPKYKDYEVGNIAQSAIGQSGVLATPMQMLLAVSSIANDGKMMQPIIVNEIKNSEGNTVQKINSKELQTVTSVENAQIVKKFMREVVQSGTGVNANIYGLDISGKTGTAEYVYNNVKKSHSWFIGFAPYDNPKIAVAVIVEDGGQGGGIAAKISSNVINEYLN